MSNKQKADNRWIEALGEFFPHGVGGIELVVKQAREMEKEQIVKANRDGVVNMVVDKKDFILGEQYYNEHYGK